MASHRCRTRPARGALTTPAILRDADVEKAHAQDGAHFPGGHADGVVFPRTEADIAGLLRGHSHVLVVGAQSSLTGGATPMGELVVSTARLDGILKIGTNDVTAQAGVPIVSLQAALSESGRLYPPVPTFTGAFVGGTVATNAAGAATFKYGATRQWVEAITIVLADGDVLELERGQCRAHNGEFVIATSAGERAVRVPSYAMPVVAKQSAGYFAAPDMDLIDLFIGSEGTLGVITEVRLRTVSPAPPVAFAWISMADESAGLALVAALRSESMSTWRHRDPQGLDVCAIEHMDARCLQILREDGVDRRHDVHIPANATLALLLQIELPCGISTTSAYDEIQNALAAGAPDTALVRLCRLLDRFGALAASELALPGDRRRAEQLIALREAVPAGVNQRVGTAQRDVDARIAKTAADMIVPFEQFGEMMEIYRAGFSSLGLDYAVWGHISDGNVHPNVLPHSYDDVEKGTAAILGFGREVTRLGGSPLAEHGVGRSPVKQMLLRQLYGDQAIDGMRAVKRALDPQWKLAPGVIFQRSLLM
jgi:D-lactate dehydrogenase (cytochrome)